MLKECGSDCSDMTNYSVEATIHTARTYPNVPFGLVEDTDDSLITLFFGFGANNCASTLLPSAQTGTQFTAGLNDLKAKVAAAGVKNVGSFIFTGTAHTSLSASSTYDTVSSGTGGTTKLSDWVTTLVNDGTTTNVAP